MNRLFPSCVIRATAIIIITSMIFAISGCTMRQIIKPSTTLTQYEKIELHLKSGSIYVLHTWKADSLGTIKGFGTRIAPEPSPQQPMELVSYSFPKDSVQAVYTLNENYINTAKPFLYVLYVVGGFCVLYLLMQFCSLPDMKF